MVRLFFNNKFSVNVYLLMYVQDIILNNYKSVRDIYHFAPVLYRDKKCPLINDANHNSVIERDICI